MHEVTLGKQIAQQKTCVSLAKTSKVIVRRNISTKNVLPIIFFQIRLLFFHGTLTVNCFENIPASYFYKGLLKVNYDWDC